MKLATPQTTQEQRIQRFLESVEEDFKETDITPKDFWTNFTDKIQFSAKPTQDTWLLIIFGWSHFRSIEAKLSEKEKIAQVTNLRDTLHHLQIKPKRIKEKLLTAYSYLIDYYTQTSHGIQHPIKTYLIHSFQEVSHTFKTLKSTPSYSLLLLENISHLEAVCISLCFET